MYVLDFSSYFHKSFQSNIFPSSIPSGQICRTSLHQRMLQFIPHSRYYRSSTHRSPDTTESAGKSYLTMRIVLSLRLRSRLPSRKKKKISTTRMFQKRRKNQNKKKETWLPPEFFLHGSITAYSPHPASRVLP